MFCMTTSPIIGVIIGGHIRDRTKNKSSLKSMKIILFILIIGNFLLDIVTYFDNPYVCILVLWTSVFIGNVFLF